MSDTTKAVFLSYASQDAEAAKRIAEALRAAGVEVWFDAEGGLEHGDEWDAKIRRQIKECVLFLPIISANTQAREEGYFRIEWELAAQRALGIASGVAFILPVVIDETKEPDALVPDRFRTVQWTRLPGGELTPEVKARFLKLWSHRTGALKHEAVSRGQGTEDGGQQVPAKSLPKSGWKIYAGLAVAVVALAAAYLIFKPRRSPEEIARIVADAQKLAAAVTPPAAPATFPRDPELRRARNLLFTMDAIPEDYRLAEDLLKPVLARQPNDPETATVAAEINQEFLSRGFDSSPARRAQVQRLAERAVQLAPDNPYALATMARYLLFIGGQLARAEELVRKAIALQPDEARFHRTLHYILFLTRPAAETDAYGERMAAQFPGDPLVAYDIARRFKDSNDLVQMENWFDRTLEREPSIAFAHIWKAWLAVWVHGDLDAMRQWIERVPDRQRNNTRVVNARYVHALFSGETRTALRALNELTDEWLTDFDLVVPKTLLTGNLALLDGRQDLARVQFETALATVNAELEKTPNDVRPLRAKLWVLIGLGRMEEARAIQRVSLQSLSRPYLTNITRINWANPIISCLLLDLRADALTLLRDSSGDANCRRVLRSLFKLDPRLKPWRDDAEIKALLAEPAATGAATVTSPVAALTPARELAGKALALLQGIEATREDFALAEDYCQRALKLDSTDAEVWAVYAQLHSAFGYRGWDTSPERREQNRVMAERAIRLAPASVQARLAQAGAWSAFGINRAETEKLLRDVVAEQPDNQPALRFLAVTMLNQGKLDECLALNERSAALPGGDPLALFNNARYLWQRSRQDEGYAMLLRSLAQKPFSSSLTLKANMEIVWRSDPEAAEATLRLIPQSDMLEDRANFTAGLVYYYQRRADATLATWGAFPRDYYADFAFDGPKGLLVGLAHELGQRDAAARIEWRTALQVVEKRLAAAPNKPAPYYHQAYLLACLGEKAAAGEALRTYEQLTGLKPTPESPMPIELAFIYARLGRFDDIFAQSPSRFIRRLRVDPRFDAMRADPRYQALLAAAPAPGIPLPAPAEQPKVDQKSVAVLAFANLSDDKANEYFSDGISEELLNVLAKIPGLKVSARTSAFYFKGKEVPIPEIARQLGVAYVVEGSVRKAGDKVRITAQLIKAADGFHVWSDTFTRELKDIFAVQDEIAGLIAKNLELKMGFSQARARGVISPAAYQEYLVGRASVAKAGLADLREAVTHFEQAVTLETKFTAAWVQLASAHTQLGRWGGAPTLQSWQAARAAIDRARALEPDSPDVLLALGWILRTGEWDWRGAELAFRRCLQLRPNHPDSLAGAAVLLFNIGKTEEAFRLGQQAAQLDPLNAATQIDLSIMFYLNHNWAASEQAARRALQLAPRGGSYHSILGWSLTAQRRYDEAEAEIARDNNESEQTQAFGTLAIARGRGAEARRWLAKLEEMAKTRGDSSDVQMNIAWIATGLGDKDRAFTALEKALTTRDPSLAWLRNSWFLEHLHADPRWPAFLRKVGLADEQLK